MRELFITDAPAATVLIRIMAGSVFLSEGIQKFLYPDDLAAGRFAKIGIPSPEVLGPFVGACEIVCGTLLIIGFLTRIAAIVLLIDISVAIVSTKIPVLLGHGSVGDGFPVAEIEVTPRKALLPVDCAQRVRILRIECAQCSLDRIAKTHDSLFDSWTQ